MLAEHPLSYIYFSKTFLHKFVLPFHTCIHFLKNVPSCICPSKRPSNQLSREHLSFHFRCFNYRNQPNSLAQAPAWREFTPEKARASFGEGMAGLSLGSLTTMFCQVAEVTGKGGVFILGILMEPGSQKLFINQKHIGRKKPSCWGCLKFTV